MDSIRQELDVHETAMAAALFDSGVRVPLKALPSLARAGEHPWDALLNQLGGASVVLKDFVEAGDSFHPDYAECFAAPEAIRLQQLVAVVEFAQSIGASDVMEGTRKSILGEAKSWLSGLGDPSRTLGRVRLLPDPESRRVARSEKQVQSIRTHSFNRRADGRTYPATLKGYVRGTSETGEIEKAIKKRDRYAKLGCTSLVREIEQSIETYQQMLAESFLGFRRATLNNVAVILAKLHGFDLSQAEDGTGQIGCDATHFSGWTIGRGDPIEYHPLAVPAHLLPKNERMERVIAHLEMLPELGGKPAFDHYIVVVPSVALTKSTGCYFKSPDGEEFSYHDEEAGILRLAIRMAEAGSALPALVGERDGKCYFISYWK